MNMISQTRIQRVLFRGWNIGRYFDRVTRLCRLGHEIAQEAYATVAGVFAMPARHPPHDKYLDRLDDHLLRDIGYGRVKGPKIDIYF